MDISPKRTFLVVGIAALVSGGILYYQEASYSPSAEQEARDTVEKAKKNGEGGAAAKSRSEARGSGVPPVAKAAPSPSPATGIGLFGSSGGFGGEVGPKMARALKNRAEQAGQQSGGGNQRRGGSSGSSGGGSSGGGSSGGGSSGGGSSSGGSSSGGSSSGGSGGSGAGGSDAEPDEETGYWLDDGTNIRHNSSCDFYQAEDGQASGPEEGVACRRCGG